MSNDDSKFAEVSVGEAVEVTHHMTFSRQWFPAKVAKVTPQYIDVLRDDWATSRPTRYRRKDGRALSEYCGFYSFVRRPEVKP